MHFRTFVMCGYAGVGMALALYAYNSREWIVAGLGCAILWLNLRVGR